MKESYCIVDKRVTPVQSQVVTNKISVVELSFIVNALFVEIKKLDM